MKTVTINTTNEKHIVQIPEHPDELRFKQFLALLETDGDYVKSMGILMGLSEDMVRNSTNILLDEWCAPFFKSFNVGYVRDLNAMQCPPQFAKPVGEMTLGQKIEARNIIVNSKNKYEAFPKLAEIFCGINEKSYLNGFLPDVFPIGHFFFVKCWILLRIGRAL
jgi:hypothetical protein